MTEINGRQKITPDPENINWLDTPMGGFYRGVENDLWPHGDGEAQRFVALTVSGGLGDMLDRVLSEDDSEEFCRTGLVPVFRDGEKVYEEWESLTLRDLPAILDSVLFHEKVQKK